MAPKRRSSSRPKRCRRSPRSTAARTSCGRRSPRSAPRSGRRATTPTSPACRSARARAPVSTDVCVPISRLAECVSETMADVKSYFAPVPLLGHVGDGNFHLMLLVDPAKPRGDRDGQGVQQAPGRARAAMEGTCTGEHGVGMGKMGSMTHGARRRRDRRDARHQETPRPREPDEPGQGRAAAMKQVAF